MDVRDNTDGRLVNWVQDTQEPRKANGCTWDGIECRSNDPCIPAGSLHVRAQISGVSRIHLVNSASNSGSDTRAKVVERSLIA